MNFVGTSEKDRLLFGRFKWLHGGKTCYDKPEWPNCARLDGHFDACIAQFPVRGEQNVMILHPLSQEQPAWISGVFDLSSDAEMFLNVEIVSPIKEPHCQPSDYIFKGYIKKAGALTWSRIIEPAVISWDDGWRKFRVSLDEWKGRRVSILLFFEAGDKLPWCHESAGLKTFSVSSERSSLPKMAR